MQITRSISIRLRPIIDRLGSLRARRVKGPRLMSSNAIFRVAGVALCKAPRTCVERSSRMIFGWSCGGSRLPTDGKRSRAHEVRLWRPEARVALLRSF